MKECHKIRFKEIKKVKREKEKQGQMQESYLEGYLTRDIRW